VLGSPISLRHRMPQPTLLSCCLSATVILRAASLAGCDAERLRFNCLVVPETGIGRLLNLLQRRGPDQLGLINVLRQPLFFSSTDNTRITHYQDTKRIDNVGKKWPANRGQPGGLNLREAIVKARCHRAARFWMAWPMFTKFFGTPCRWARAGASGSRRVTGRAWMQLVSRVVGGAQVPLVVAYPLR
jgi:hypothetical protein